MTVPSTSAESYVALSTAPASLTVSPPVLLPGRWPVAVLGATGAVGQTFVRLLANHPWFTVTELAASDRSAGRQYAETVRWLEGEMPADVATRRVMLCDPAAVTAPIVFSALDSAVAGEIEPAFAQAGRIVLSNAKNFRLADDVPLVIPEVNGDHLALITEQRARRGWTGAIITNANCAATVAAMALAPLHEEFGLTRVFIATMQAVSGAGYPGVASLDVLGNVIPYIADEESKIERELPKMLGRFDGNAIAAAGFRVSAHANRVAVEHGHTAVMSCAFSSRPTPLDALAVLRAWRGRPQARALPSAPALPLVVDDAPDRPQARRDVNRGNGMTVTVGRVRADTLFDLRLVALGHNTIRGAAGGSILNAEWLAAHGMLPGA
jgi:aspartate-semialdehyde dehydrogenase